MKLLTLLLVSGLALADLNNNLLEEENRLLDGLEDVQKKAIEYKSAGDYTLVSIPWSGSTSLAFNDSTAATISTLGNAALLVGGLYLLSGFPSALARSDPFGVQRRFGAPAAPAPPAKMFRMPGPAGGPNRGAERQKARRQHRDQRQRGVERRGPAQLRPEERTLQDNKQERQFNIQRPILPQLRPFQLRMPSLPNLRLPTFPGLGRPRQRPQSSRPAPAPQSSRPAPAPQSSRPAPAPQSSRPAPAPQSSRPAPATQSSRPAPAPQLSRPAPAQQSSRPSAPLRTPPRPEAVIPSVQQSAPLVLPDPRPAAPSDFGSAFESDPFREFQTAEFGNDQSFQDLIATQFGDSFDFKKLRK